MAYRSPEEQVSKKLREKIEKTNSIKLKELEEKVKASKKHK